MRPPGNRLRRSSANGRGLRTGFLRGLVTEHDDPAHAPRAFMEEATDLARRWAAKVRGVTAAMFTETLLGVRRRPTSSAAAAWAPTPPRA